MLDILDSLRYFKVFKFSIPITLNAKRFLHYQVFRIYP